LPSRTPLASTTPCASPFNSTGYVYHVLERGGELSALGSWRGVGKRKGRQRHTEFTDMSAEEISEIARDPHTPPARRRRAQAEEKARQLRNRRKRKGA